MGGGCRRGCRLVVVGLSVVTGGQFLYCGKNSVLGKSLSVLWEEFFTTEMTFCTVGRILH